MKLEYILKTQDTGRPKHCFYKKTNSETDKPLENLIRKNDWQWKHTIRGK